MFIYLNRSPGDAGTFFISVFRKDLHKWCKMSKQSQKRVQNAMDTNLVSSSSKKQSRTRIVETRVARWRKMKMAPAKIHECVIATSTSYKKRQKSALYAQILTLYDLLCSFYCEYETSILPWTQIAKKIVVTSIKYLKTYSSTLNRLYVVDMGMCASLLLDDMKSAKYIAEFIVKDYETHPTEIPDKKGFDPEDYEDIMENISHRNIEYLLAMYIMGKKIGDCPEPVSLISKSRVRGPKLLLQALKALEQGKVEKYLSAIEEYLSYYLMKTRFNSDFSFLQQYYSPLISCVYNFGIKSGLNTKVTDKTTFKCSLFDDHITWKQKKFLFAVNDFVLSAAQLNLIQPPEPVATAKKRTEQSGAKKDCIIVPDEVDDIQEALDQVQEHGTIKIRSGHYLINRPIEIKTNVVVQGDTEDCTDTIIQNTNGSVLSLSKAEAKFTGITFYSAIYFVDAVIVKSGTVSFDKCRFMSDEKSGCRCEGKESLIDFTNCVFEQTRAYGLCVASRAKVKLSDCIFKNCLLGCEVSDHSQLSAINSDVSGTVFVNKHSIATFDHSALTNITAMDHSTMTLTNSTIILYNMSCIGACQESCMKLEDCSIQGANLTPFYASGSGIISLFRCNITTKKKKLTETAGGQVTFEECDFQVTKAQSSRSITQG